MIVLAVLPACHAASRNASKVTGSPSGAAAAASPTPRSTPQPALAAGGAPYCGASEYVSEITVEKWPNGDFRVSLRPTDAGRHASDRTAASNVMWQQIRRCLTPSAGFSNLDGTVGDSLQDQLHCHEFLALLPALNGGRGYATGDTFDLESWRPTFGESRWYSTRCGNTLGTDPSGRPAETYRPDGVTIQSTTAGEHE